MIEVPGQEMGSSTSTERAIKSGKTAPIKELMHRESMHQFKKSQKEKMNDKKRPQ